MDRGIRRQVAQVRKRAASVIGEWNKRGDEVLQLLRDAARGHAMKVCALSLYGEPRIDEELRHAWGRVEQKLGLEGLPEEQVARKLRESLKIGRTGDAAISKLAAILSSAPPWLLAFCSCAHDAGYLGFDLTIGPSASVEAQPQDSDWPQLPRKLSVPIPEETVSEDLHQGWPGDISPELNKLSTEEVNILWELSEKSYKNWTRRERALQKRIIAKTVSTLPPEVRERAARLWGQEHDL